MLLFYTYRWQNLLDTNEELCIFAMHHFPEWRIATQTANQKLSTENSEWMGKWDMKHLLRNERHINFILLKFLFTYVFTELVP